MMQEQNQWMKITMGIMLIAGMLLLAKLAAMMTGAHQVTRLSENEINGQTDEADTGRDMTGVNDISSNSSSREREPGQLCIVIDPGHGGADPGKVGVNGVLEKDINLQMAFLLKERLEEEGFYIVMTRESDQGLCSENSGSSKVEDLQNRIRLMAQEEPVLAVSIHQNSYTQESVCGAQTFYYETSEEGRRLAECIQEQLIIAADDGNHREIKGNTSYFLLKKTPVTTVIVECGFLSNWREAELLTQEEYQRLMVNAIADGILEYLEK